MSTPKLLEATSEARIRCSCGEEVRITDCILGSNNMTCPKCEGVIVFRFHAGCFVFRLRDKGGTHVETNDGWVRGADKLDN